MTTEDMLALRIRQLEKCPEDIAQAASTLHRSRIRSKEQFEKIYARRMRREEYNPGDLVLVRNTQIEKELDRKSKPRYLGPFEVVRRTKGGSYVLQEMDGTVSRRGVAAFRLIPYFTRNSMPHMTTLNENSDDDSDDEEHDDAYDD